MKSYYYVLAVVAAILLIITLLVLPRPHLDQKYLLISVHDVSPFYEEPVNQLLDELEKREIHNFTILIVPNWDGQYDFNEDQQLVERLLNLQNEGTELALHGYDHHSFDLERAEASIPLEQSLTLYQTAFGNKPRCFVPPRYSQNSEVVALLKETGFSCTESTYTLEYFSGQKYTSLPISMESFVNNKYLKYDFLTPFLTKTFSRIYARLVWNRGGVVRYTLHPREIEIGNLNATLELLDGFLARGWQPLTYSELEVLNLSG